MAAPSSAATPLSLKIYNQAILFLTVKWFKTFK